MFALSLAVTRCLSSQSCDRTAFDLQTSSCRSSSWYTILSFVAALRSNSYLSTAAMFWEAFVGNSISFCVGQLDDVEICALVASSG
jgi:hypothetical protein